MSKTPKHVNEVKRAENTWSKVSANSESVSKSVTLEEMKNLLDSIDKPSVEFDEWKRVETDGKKMKVVKVSIPKEEFVTKMIEEYTDFLSHVNRVHAQYSALHELKANLPQNELVVQMDFAENFTSSSMDEIRSAYWNATNVSLHPTVVYYRNEHGDMEHKNFVFVSDVINHNATAVLTIIDILIKELKTIFPNADLVHYWTDSPSSQYRNRYIIHAIGRHEECYGLRARQNYFEAGHGKGPCDGIGGTAKRQAADAIKQGKVSIQDASDFYAWGVQNQKSITYRFYSLREYEQMAEVLSRRKPIAIQGTMKLHAVFPREDGLYTAEVSCYCTECIRKDGNLCAGWKSQKDYHHDQ